MGKVRWRTRLIALGLKTYLMASDDSVCALAVCNTNACCTCGRTLGNYLSVGVPLLPEPAPPEKAPHQYVVAGRSDTPTFPRC